MEKTVVLVTGANKGIGLEIVRALLSSAPSSSGTGSGAPYHVYLGSRDLEKGKAAISSMEIKGDNTVSPIQLEMTSSESIASAVSTMQTVTIRPAAALVRADEMGRVDVLINNAGITSRAADGVTQLRENLETNLIAPYVLTESLKPLLLTQPTHGKKDKRIIHVTSSMGSITERLNPNFAYYNVPHSEYRVTKAGLGMLTACNAFELKKEGVKVFAFDPGYIATDFSGDDKEQMKQWGAGEPGPCGLNCRDIVEGKRDDDRDLMVGMDGQTWAW